jgi:hypothetical protein
VRIRPEGGRREQAARSRFVILGPDSIKAFERAGDFSERFLRASPLPDEVLDFVSHVGGQLGDSSILEGFAPPQPASPSRNGSVEVEWLEGWGRAF